MKLKRTNAELTEHLLQICQDAAFDGMMPKKLKSFFYTGLAKAKSEDDRAKHIQSVFQQINFPTQNSID